MPQHARHGRVRVRAQLPHAGAPCPAAVPDRPVARRCSFVPRPAPQLPVPMRRVGGPARGPGRAAAAGHLGQGAAQRGLGRGHCARPALPDRHGHGAGALAAGSWAEQCVCVWGGEGSSTAPPASLLGRASPPFSPFMPTHAQSDTFPLRPPLSHCPPPNTHTPPASGLLGEAHHGPTGAGVRAGAVRDAAARGAGAADAPSEAAGVSRRKRSVEREREREKQRDAERCRSPRALQPQPNL